MENDICTCSKTFGEHDGTGLNGACLNFTIDRKATYWAEKNAAALARSVQLAEDIKSGRVRPIRPLEDMVRRTDERLATGGERGQTRVAVVFGIVILSLMTSIWFSILVDYRNCKKVGGLLVHGLSWSGYVCAGVPR